MSVQSGNEGSAARWPFRIDDAFHGLDARAREALIHSLPGVVFWPLLLWLLAFAGAFIATVIWTLSGAEAGPIAFGTVLMVFIALAYALLMSLFYIWTGSRGYGAAVFRLWPVRWSDPGLALLALLIAILVGGPLSVLIHDLAMLDPTLTVSGGADPNEISNVETYLQAGASAWALALATVIAAPLAEEILFRGWMQPMIIARGVPTVLAILISALFFGLVHMFDGLQVMAYTFFLGIALGVLRQWTGRLAAPVIAHMLNNAWALFGAPFVLQWLG